MVGGRPSFWRSLGRSLGRRVKKDPAPMIVGIDLVLEPYRARRSPRARQPNYNNVHGFLLLLLLSSENHSDEKKNTKKKSGTTPFLELFHAPSTEVVRRASEREVDPETMRAHTQCTARDPYLRQPSSIAIELHRPGEDGRDDGDESADGDTSGRRAAVVRANGGDKKIQRFFFTRRLSIARTTRRIFTVKRLHVEFRRRSTGVRATRFHQDFPDGFFPSLPGRETFFFPPCLHTQWPIFNDFPAMVF